MNLTPQREPVWYGAIARVLVAAAASQGLQLSADEVFMVIAAVEVVVAVFTRPRVTPVQ